MHFIQESEDWGQRDFSSSLSRAEAMECKTRAVSLFCEDSESEIRENEADKQRIRERLEHWTAGTQCTPGTAGSLSTSESHSFPNATYTPSTSSFKTPAHLKVVAWSFTNPAPSMAAVHSTPVSFLFDNIGSRLTALHSSISLVITQHPSHPYLSHH